MADLESEESSPGSSSGLESDESDESLHRRARPPFAHECRECWLRFRLATERAAGGAAKLAKTNLAVVTLARWLFLQDVGSDVYVTFCKESFTLCSGDGFFWDADEPWWGWLSVLFMVLPCVLSWALALSLVVRARPFRGVPAPVLVALWGVFGLPATMLLDLTSILLFPCWQPKQAVLLNFMRLRLILEAFVESPMQGLLQARVFYVKLTSSDQRLRENFEPWALLFSFCTSQATFLLALLDINALAKEQGISFCGALADTLCVGLGWRAPLLHTLKLRSHVDFSDEGQLTEEHCSQIARTAKASGPLRSMKFGAANKLTSEGVEQLQKIVRQEHAPFLRSPSARMAVMEWQDTSGDRHIACGDNVTGAEMQEIFGSMPEQLTGKLHVHYNGGPRLTDGGLRELAASLPEQLAGSLHLNFEYNQKFTDGGLRELAASLPQQLAGSLHLNFEFNKNFTDEGFRELAASLPKQLAGSLYLNFANNNNFTDGGLRELAASVPKQLAGSLHLNFASNDNFTDGGLRELAAALPKQLAGDLLLNFHSSDKFTDGGLRELAASLPKQLAGDLFLNFWHNKNFTDGGLRELAASLPKQLAGSLYLNFEYNKNFTDRGLRELAASLPKQLAGSLYLGFADNENFTDGGLRELAASLPKQLAGEPVSPSKHKKHGSENIMEFKRTGRTGIDDFKRRYRA